MRHLSIKLFKLKYKYIIRPILFKIDSEFVHEWIIKLGILLGKCKITRWFLKLFWGKEYQKINKEILNIKFKSPIGLSAGFDYDGKITDILPSLGFGFITIGTVTNKSYEGNPKPRLGRLIETKALLVNKGFKSSGIDNVLKRLKNKKFQIPTGISIGKSNLPEINTQALAEEDIISSFKKIKFSNINFSFYELNISCPNLFGDVEFYSDNNLRSLLKAVSRLEMNKPIFIKMPIEKTDQETIQMLNIISEFKDITGVIFGNLQKNRNHPSIKQDEIKKYKKGYPSGLPTQKRSTELIKLTKEIFEERFVIIGCGGIFNHNDAREKLNAGADLLQLITGLIYEGPQLVADINSNLNRLS